MSQTPKERSNLKTNIQPPFKIKRAVLETTSIDASTVIVKQSEKKVFIVEGEHLRLVAEMKTKRDIIWDQATSEEVKQTYFALIE